MMNKVLTIIVTLLILTSSPCYAENTFSSPSEFSHWLMFYYQNPEPDKIPDAVKYMSTSGVLDKKMHMLHCLAF